MWRASALFCAVVMVLCAQPTAYAAALQGPARVIDGDTIDLEGVRIRLFGIDAPEHNQNCTDTRGRKWACGTFATEALSAVASGNLSCEELDRDRYGRVVARCFAGGRDIGAQMVAQGAAFAYRKYSTDYIALEARAESRGVGLWSGEAERPEAFRNHKAAQSGATSAAVGGCKIKGNISKSGQIYHVPGQKFYAKTSISEAKGERWFCSESEARAAGWRAAKQ